MDMNLFSFSALWSSGVLAFIALFAPINPVGTAMIVNPFFGDLDMQSRRVAVRKVVFYCLILSVIVMLSGEAILRLFGIEFSVIRMGGGLLLCGIAWRMLFATQPQGQLKHDVTKTDVNSMEETAMLNQVSQNLFYPVAFPFTLGPGAIAVLISLSVQGEKPTLSSYVFHMLAVFSAVCAILAVVYFSFVYTKVLVLRLGQSGAQVLNRISAFLVFCVGLQMVVTGIHQAFHL